MPLTGAILRVARASERLDEVTAFYVDGLGFTRLAGFEDHAGFDGVVLGHPQAPYHLEFTRRRGHSPSARPDGESLLVFYLPDADQWRAAIDRLEAFGAKAQPALNPYWDASGRTFEDPDGYRIVLQNAAWPL
jgi:catechol 2,3-dioxygenase-like lactoylglutathione lyase family enzyme